MWYLDEYEKESELLNVSYPLQGTTNETIKELMGIGVQSAPIEAAMHEVAQEDLGKFAKCIDGELSIDVNCTYFVGFFAD